MHLVVMGVSGSGKTVVAEALARRLGWTFADADAFHSLSNIAKMSAGQPLDDDDRAPWLDAIVSWLQSQRGTDVVLAFSALKRAYRDRFSDVQWVYLRVPRGVVAARLAARTGHFFAPSLLDSQLAALEEPAGDERVLTLEATRPPEALVDTVVATLQL